MKQVYLTVGPQGAGKTTFCRQLVAACPDVVLLERDAYFTELFGNDWLDPYLGLNRLVENALKSKIAELLEQENIRLILDCWTWGEKDRQSLVEYLRICGATYVAAWNFITGEDIVALQYSHRFAGNTMYQRICENSGRVKCRDYRKQSVTLDQGFDEVLMIDPYQLTLFPWPDLIL